MHHLKALLILSLLSPTLTSVQAHAATQPKKGWEYTGSVPGTRKAIKVEVVQFYGDVGYIAAQLTYPKKITMDCYLYDSNSQKFVSKKQKRIPFAAVHQTSAAQIKKGKFFWENTYGGQVCQRYQGTFTKNRLQGKLETLKVCTALGIECTHPAIKFDLLRNN